MKNSNISNVLKNYETTTSIDLQNVLINQFYCYLPRNLEYAVYNNFDDNCKEICDHMDILDFHYRHYIIGNVKTLNKLLFEVTELLNLKTATDYHKRTIIQLVISKTEDIILKHELYELMPRQLNARRKIQELIGTN